MLILRHLAPNLLKVGLVRFLLLFKCILQFFSLCRGFGDLLLDCIDRLEVCRLNCLQILKGLLSLSLLRFLFISKCLRILGFLEKFYPLLCIRLVDTLVVDLIKITNEPLDFKYL